MVTADAVFPARPGGNGMEAQVRTDLTSTSTSCFLLAAVVWPIVYGLLSIVLCLTSLCRHPSPTTNRNEHMDRIRSSNGRVAGWGGLKLIFG